MTEPQITFVKKIKSDGNFCNKCVEVEQKLKDAGAINLISNIVVADERDENSEGMLLAKKYNVTQAPFFLVEDGVTATKIYTIYLKFVKEVLNERIDASAEAIALLEDSDDLNFI